MTDDNFQRYVILLSKLPDKSDTLEIIREHVAYIRSLDDRGILVLAGPFLDYRGGMVIIKAASLDEADGIALTDPFVIHGVRNFEIRTWQLSTRENNYLL